MMSALLVFSTLMTAGAFYFAFVSRERLFKLWRVAAFGVFLLFTLVAAYGSLEDRNASARLAMFVEPYPHTSQIIWVPAGGPGGRYWIFKTPDSNETVVTFYRDMAQREGWTIQADDGHTLSMRKDTRCLTLIVSRTRSAGKTTIIYSLREDC
jgi:hypothetical protein